MLLYKYKSPSQLSHILDIIFYRRLYMANFDSLNDPMERMVEFKYMRPHLSSTIGFLTGENTAEFNKSMNSNRICSLCESNNNILMWAHYGKAFSGFCFEFDFRNTEPAPVPVDYSNEGKSVINLTSEKIDSYVWKVITTKDSSWSYEKERRLIRNTEYTNDILLTQIFHTAFVDQSALALIRKIAPSVIFREIDLWESRGKIATN